ncbi:protein translocase SEC61 complex subunit gamma [Candidatus Woesearchaeota archaeon]|nr:protein translocase SEC61 complex subunit gamma [Candidatus Woesearchaeota archaeon]
MDEYETPVQEQQTRLDRLRHFFAECVRVVKVTKKPTMLEFKTIVKVSALGIALIGLLGFLTQLIKEIFL